MSTIAPINGGIERGSTVRELPRKGDIFVMAVLNNKETSHTIQPVSPKSEAIFSPEEDSLTSQIKELASTESNYTPYNAESIAVPILEVQKVDTNPVGIQAEKYDRPEVKLANLNNMFSFMASLRLRTDGGVFKDATDQRSRKKQPVGA